MSKIVDARGLACPQPVVLTRKALQESDAVVTIVDNETAKSNVSRMAARQGCQVDVEEREDGIYVHLTKGEKLVEETAPLLVAAPASGPLVLTVPSDVMGRGDEELGGVLVRAFFHTLGEVEPLPQTIIFFNSGVKLVVEGSPVVEDLQALEAQGMEILACGTCLGYYGLKEKVAVGEVSNMYTIAETMLGTGKVVSL
ncbi:MAG: sulfurtransferase-like selenium metabolism protein YedF [Anaerolineales bacterium]|nr:MAG: sulfurtransferase-like selenium metabolism protein YedF [Anaerolineales bacterium]